MLRTARLGSSGGAQSAEALSAWVSARLAAHEAALAALLAIDARAPRKTPSASTTPPSSSSAWPVRRPACSTPLPRTRRFATRPSWRPSASPWPAQALSLNRPFTTLWPPCASTAAIPATTHYVERTLLSYRLAGVDKDDATRAHLQSLHEKATQLSLEFSRNIQEGAKTIEATEAELDGLPPDYLDRHQPDADGQVTLSTDQPDMQPVMTFANSAALRERMFLAYNTRAYPANKEILEQLLATRQEIATVLGFRSWADLATADQMMGSAANVRTFLAQARRSQPRRRPPRGRTGSRLRPHAASPASTTIDITSRGYWYEQFRRSAFDFDSQSVRPYFPYAKVEAGVLETAARLFKVEFRPSSAPAWDPAVSVFEVREGGKLVGRFYLDMHPRDGKDKWFSAAPIVTGVRGRYLPEAALICNFPGGDPGEPGLLQYNDVVTFFHEFGHLMHAILGGHTEWAGLSGFATEGDFIEVPSQMLEEFFRDEKLLQSFARHYQTGEVLPAEIIRKMKKAGAFGRADGMRTQLYYTTLSLDLHDQDPAGIDLDRIIKQLYQRFQPWTWLEGNRMYAASATSPATRPTTTPTPSTR